MYEALRDPKSVFRLPGEIKRSVINIFRKKSTLKSRNLRKLLLPLMKSRMYNQLGLASRS